MRMLTRANGLRLLLLLYLVAGLSFWFVGVRDRVNYWRSSEPHVESPFSLDPDSHKLQSLTPDGQRQGLQAGEVLESVNDVPYSGLASLQERTLLAKPGDAWSLGLRRQDGTLHRVDIVLARRAASSMPSRSLLQSYLALFITPLICLLIGAWAVLVKPKEPNAWLLLGLLTYPEVLFLNTTLATGTTLLLCEFWYMFFQLAVPFLLPIFGLRFPERSRIDVRWPWVKRAILSFGSVAAVLVLLIVYRQFYVGREEHWRFLVFNWLSAAVNLFNLFCVLFYAVINWDNLRSASTADARRRMRLLCIGGGVGVGSLLLFFVALPAFGSTAVLIKNLWIAYIGAALFMAAPLTFAYVVVVERAMDVRVLLRIGTKYLLARTFFWVLQFGIVGAVVLHLLPHLAEKRQPEMNDLPEIALILGFIFLLRTRVSRTLEAWLDRKFFREAYDADQVLRDLSEQVRRYTDADPMLKIVTRNVAEALHISRVAVLLRSKDGFRLQESVGFTQQEEVFFDSHASTIRKLAQRTSALRLHKEETDGWYFLASPTELKALEQLKAEILLPMPGSNRLMGLMALGPKKSEAAYSRNDLTLLETVASQTGLALEVSELAHSLAEEAAQRERVHREIEIAREVQEKLFPQQIPPISNATIAGACRPALGVGGDYYDVIPMEDGRIGIAIGDVSGKGISAALLMASLRASLRGATIDAPHDLAKLMEKVSRLVYEASASNRYATFFFAAYDPSTRILEYVNAGHNPPLLFREEETIRLEAGGPVIGLLPGVKYEQQNIVLRPCDMLLTYTDGISEAMTVQQEEWGEERLESLARKCSGTAESILKDIFHAVDAFTAGAPPHDDMTLLVMKLSSDAA